MKQKIFIFLIIILFAGFFAVREARAGAQDNVYGWAWADTIGWISMNRANFEHWTLVDEYPNPDYYDTYVWTDSTVIPPNEQRDAYNIEDPPAGLPLPINSVQAYLVYQGCAIVYPRLSGAQSGSMQICLGGGMASASAINLNRPGGGDWTWNNITDLQVVIGLWRKTSGVQANGEVTQVYVVVNYNGGSLTLRPNGEGDFTNIANPPPLAGENYGVHICQSDTDPNPRCAAIPAPKTGKFVGYAWSDNIGWIQFDPAGPYPPPALNPYSACLDFPASISTSEPCNGVGDYMVAGWARACAVFPEGSCSGALRPDSERGDWDGWIKLRGTAADGSPYRTRLDTSVFPPQFRGWAWSDNVIGWVSFNRRNCDTDQDGFSNGAAGCPLAGTPISNYKVMTDLDINPAPSANNLNRTEGNYCNCEVGQITKCSGSKSSPPIYLNWTFNDPGDTQSAYQIQIDNSGAGFPSPEIDTCVPANGTCEPGSSGPGPDYSYTPPGLSFVTTYWWRLKVWDNGVPAAESNWINAPASFTTAAHRWPNTDFTPNPLNPPAGVEVTFKDNSKCYTAVGGEYDCKDGAGVSYNWNFGDASPIDTTKGDTKHTYLLIGNYIVRLEVTDSMCPCVFPLTTALPLPIWKEIAPF